MSNITDDKWRKEINKVNDNFLCKNNSNKKVNTFN